jgi:hypothetical protein
MDCTIKDIHDFEEVNWVGFPFKVKEISHNLIQVIRRDLPIIILSKYSMTAEGRKSPTLPLYPF